MHRGGRTESLGRRASNAQVACGRVCATQELRERPQAQRRNAQAARKGHMPCRVAPGDMRRAESRWGLQSSCRTREKTSRLLTRVRAVRATQPPETRKNPFQHPLRLLPPNIARVRVCPCGRFRKRCIFSNERNLVKKTSEGVTRETLSDGNPATSPHALARYLAAMALHPSELCWYREQNGGKSSALRIGPGQARLGDTRGTQSEGAPAPAELMKAASNMHAEQVVPATARHASQGDALAATWHPRSGIEPVRERKTDAAG